MLTFQQPFVVGPGFSPVPAKVVAQIVVGKFIPLADLLADNLTQHDPEPQLRWLLGVHLGDEKAALSHI